jgi:hypothetical protein
MTPGEAVSRIPSNILQAFMGRIPPAFRDRVSILEAPTSELREELEYAKARGGGWSGHPLFARRLRGRPVSASATSSGKARVEENYFYSTRRFPTLTTNTIGGGALVANNYPYFGKGLNDDGAPLGFPTGFVLGPPETNMEVGGSIPQGTSFVFNQIGVTFDSDIVMADLSVMMDAATLAFSKAGGQFALSHGPVKMWPGGMGIDGVAAAATTAATTTINLQGIHNGTADLRAVRSLKIPRILREKETFAYSLVITRATKAKDGTTIALSTFVLPTIWLFGGQRNVIPA